MINYK